MSARGSCYDNACVESYFHSLKVECIHGECFTSRETIQEMVFAHIKGVVTVPVAVLARNSLKISSQLRTVSTLRGLNQSST